MSGTNSVTSCNKAGFGDEPIFWYSAYKRVVKAYLVVTKGKQDEMFCFKGVPTILYLAMRGLHYEYVPKVYWHIIHFHLSPGQQLTLNVQIN